MTTLTTDEDKQAIQRALNDIHFYRGVVPVQAYEVLAKHQKEVTPYLLDTLEMAIKRHDRTSDYYTAHINALLLLGQFKEKKAYPIYMKLLNLPIESIDRLLGDILTETSPKFIASTYDGNPEPLFSLLTNSKAEDFLRLVIAGCFSTLIYQKLIDKNMVLKRLQEIVASGKMNNDPAFFTALADLAMVCKLEPLYDTIRAAFKTDLILNPFMDLEFFEKTVATPVEQITELEDLNPLNDAASELGQWEGYSGTTPSPVKIQRNDDCPCGSGQKFKKCCISRL